MSYWNDIGLLKRDNNRKCYEKAYLLEKAEGGILEKAFDFETVSEETYQEVSGITGQYTNRTKTIYTPFYWMNFCRGARVKFADGKELVIKDISEVIDSQKVLADGKGLKGLEITF